VNKNSILYSASLFSKITSIFAFEMHWNHIAAYRTCYWTTSLDELITLNNSYKHVQKYSRSDKLQSISKEKIFFLFQWPWNLSNSKINIIIIEWIESYFFNQKKNNTWLFVHIALTLMCLDTNNDFLKSRIIHIHFY